jgi:anthranilate phosphoribosyltransferase
MRGLLQKITERKGLAPAEARSAMDRIMGGSSTPAQTAAFLVALKMKGETREEVAAFAEAMRAKAVNIRPSREPLVDTCGTGGDSSGTFNISTAAAIIAAGSGVAVAKHGNRAVSGKSGSADVLEELGVGMHKPDDVRRCIDEAGIGFMFAPFFHPAMKNVAEVRRELGIRTVFNILGPLTNPAGAGAQVLGVYDPELTGTMADVLMRLGAKRALVVHSEGMDEIGLGTTKISELRDGRVETRIIDASEFGIDRADVPRADSKEESARIILDVLRAKLGPARDIAALNAAAAIYVGGIAESIADGLARACRAIDSTAAFGKLEELRNFRPG